MASLEKINLDLFDKYGKASKAKIVELLIIDYDTCSQNLLAAYDQKDLDLIFNLVHKLKPNVKLIGLNSCYEFLEVFEDDLLNTKEINNLGEKINYIVDQLNAAKVELVDLQQSL